MVPKIYKSFHLEAIIKPIANEKIKLGFWFGEGDVDDNAIVHSKGSKSSTSLVEVGGGKVEVGTNLVFGLEHISPVSARLNRTVCA